MTTTIQLATVLLLLFVAGCKAETGTCVSVNTKMDFDSCIVNATEKTCNEVFEGDKTFVVEDGTTGLTRCSFDGFKGADDGAKQRQAKDGEQVALTRPRTSVAVADDAGASPLD